jgi:protein phosphatase
MRLLIVSDIHSNIAALQAVIADAERVDAVAFVGDAVDYGPRPAECVDWLRENATWAVRGNHDHALAYHVDCRASAPFHALSVASRAMNQERVTEPQRAFLGTLPLLTRFTFAGARFGMVHAAPSDPLYRYLPMDLSDAALAAEMGELMGEADVILLGHTHLPFVRQLGSVQIVNPGSVGQPKHGDPRAAYALWEDGKISLCFAAYPVEDTVGDLQTAGLPEDIEKALVTALRAGCPPAGTGD